MKPQQRIRRCLREMYYAMDFLPDQESVNQVLDQLARVETKLDEPDSITDETAELQSFFKALRKEYDRDEPEDRSLGRLLWNEGLDLYQSHRIIMAEANAYSSKDARRRVRDAIETILEDGIRMGD